MAKEGKVEKGFKVLREIISPENVQEMAELITVKQTKCLIGYIGDNAIKAHEKVYIDVMHKDDESYVMSDYYDLVQDVALFLSSSIERIYTDTRYAIGDRKARNQRLILECPICYRFNPLRNSYFTLQFFSL